MPFFLAEKRPLWVKRKPPELEISALRGEQRAHVPLRDFKPQTAARGIYVLRAPREERGF